MLPMIPTASERKPRNVAALVFISVSDPDWQWIRHRLGAAKPGMVRISD
jgi:hypothetical protein